MNSQHYLSKISFKSPRNEWVNIMPMVGLSVPLWRQYFNTLRPRQNGRLFTDTFKRFFLNENISILIKNSLKFVPKGSINNNPALVLIMAWRRPGDKPLSEPMLVRSLTHICVTRPQWVNQDYHPSSEPILTYHQRSSYNHLREILQEIFSHQLLKLTFNITNLKLHLNLRGMNELT